MADTIEAVETILNTGRFGSPTLVTTPKDGVTGSEHHNVSSAAYRVGTVLQLWNSGASNSAAPAGWSEFVYAQFDVNDAKGGAATLVVAPTAITDLFDLTNDPNDCAAIGYGLEVVMLTALDNDKFGWFWSGGVYPCDIVSGLAYDDTLITVTGGAIAGGNEFYGKISSEDIGLELHPDDGGTTDVSPFGVSLGACNGT